MKDAPVIVIAGASGFIGRTVIPKLLERFPNARITALSRSQPKSDDDRVTWKTCDLFSLKSLEEAVPERVDLALYLVHSMGPTAELDQGSFADYDLLLADNFARSMQKKQIQHLIYLGGLVPESSDLSLHLRSRLEVEEIFAQYNLPTTIFRAGLILGEAGSSFQILVKLVRRLPVMICPRWTQTLTTPVDLPTVLDALTTAALEPQHVGKVYDLAGCRPITYMQMMRDTAVWLGKRRHFLAVPFFTPTLSRLWLSLITNTPKNLVYPLVESLEHSMVARDNHVFSKDPAERSYMDLLEKASIESPSRRPIFRFRARSKTVRSIQRLPLAPGHDAEKVRRQYESWLPRFLSPLIRVRENGPDVAFSIGAAAPVLLRLRFNSERSNPDRQLLYIVGGLLAAGSGRGRLEFRVVLNRKFVLAAIHDYEPSLPWFIYKYTQAKLHLFVMNAFARYLLTSRNAVGSA